MTTEEELKAIDYEIKRLKVQYDLYFAGTQPRAPHDQREALARQLKKFKGVSLTNMAERFLYNAVVNKFNTLQELWIKMTRIKEEGARAHPLAVRAAQRKAMLERAAEKGSQKPGDSRAAAAKGPTATAQAAPAAAAGTPPAPAAGAARAASDAREAAADAAAWRLRPAGGDDPNLKSLYESFIAARKGAGENRPLGFDTFAREVARHMEALKAKSDCEAVEFKIYSRDNKVTLKARPAGKG